MAQTIKVERKTLLTPKFRVSFPQVFQARAFQEGQTKRFSLVGLWTPAAFDDDDKAKWRAILVECDRVAQEFFKKTYKELKEMGGAYKLPFHKGEEKAYTGYGPGITFATMACTKIRPKIINLDATRTEIVEGGPIEFYAGCWARASVNPYPFNNIGKGIALGLRNLIKLADGDRLDNVTNPEDDFGEDLSAYEPGSEDALGDAGGADDFDPTA